MEMTYTSMASEVENMALNYWEDLVKKRAQKVNHEENEDGFIIHGVTTEAVALYGKKVPPFAIKYIPDGEKPVRFLDVNLGFDNGSLKVKYKQWTEVGASYVGSAKKDTDEFIKENPSYKLLELKEQPDKGTYKAVFNKK